MKKDPVANSTKLSVTFEAPAEIQAEYSGRGGRVQRLGRDRCAHEAP